MAGKKTIWREEKRKRDDLLLNQNKSAAVEAEKIEEQTIQKQKEKSLIYQQQKKQKNQPFKIGAELHLPKSEREAMGQQPYTPEQHLAIAQAKEEAEYAKKQKQLTQDIQQPKLRSLAPKDIPLQNIPVMGGSIATGVNILNQGTKKVLGTGGLKVPSLQPETLGTQTATDIEQQIYDEGISANEQFGALIEGIPIVGSLVKKYAGGLIETPSSNVDTMVSSIVTERRRGINFAASAKTGLISPETAIMGIEDIENNMQRLESKIRLLINFSPELRKDPEQINKIETEILRTREILWSSKIAAQTKAPLPTE